jgi:hypothetical protein
LPSPTAISLCFCMSTNIWPRSSTTPLTSDADVNAPIKAPRRFSWPCATQLSATRASTSRSREWCTWFSRSAIYSTYGSELWSLRADLFHRLRSFHNCTCCSMCRIAMAHTTRHHIKTEALHQRLGLHSAGRYYHNRFLQWVRYIAPMSMGRLPRILLKGRAAHPRPTGCPHMAFFRTSNNKRPLAKEYNNKFEGPGCLCVIEKDRQRWLEVTNPKPPPYPRPPRTKPPNAPTAAPPPPAPRPPPLDQLLSECGPQKTASPAH